jgi:predicted ABC-type ATPase
MLFEIKRRIARGESFAFETTLSGRYYAKLITDWREAGYHVKMIFLNLPDPELAIARVAARVSQGGHHVPEPVVRRRFESGLKNFHDIYRRLVNSWALYDNSGEKPRLITMGDNQ